MQTYFAILAAVLALTIPARPNELTPNISSVTANIKIGKTVEMTRLDEPVFRNVICNFVITPASSTPPSVILAGKVVSNNSGTAQEFVPLFFGSTLHHPRLAALTNADGEFRFRVWLLDKPNGKPASNFQPHGNLALSLQTTSIREATLYLEGRFDKDAEMVSSYTHIHSLRAFLERGAKPTP